MHASFRFPSSRLLATWVLLLAAAQLVDVITTGVDLAYGGVEATASSPGSSQRAGWASFSG